MDVTGVELFLNRMGGKERTIDSKSPQGVWLYIHRMPL